MRLLASFAFAHADQDAAVQSVARALEEADFDLLGTRHEDAALAFLVEDLPQSDAELFKDTLVHLFRHPNALVAAVNVPKTAGGSRVRVRIRHEHLRQLMDVGELVIRKILQETNAPILSSCGVREKNQPSDFLFGTFVTRAIRFRDYLREHPLRLRVTALLSSLGLGLEIGLNFAHTGNKWVAFGQRLGAPLLTAAFIAFLEMLFAWRSERRTPQFAWRTRPELDTAPETLLGA
jgi:hypothetical protein